MKHIFSKTLLALAFAVFQPAMAQSANTRHAYIFDTGPLLGHDQTSQEAIQTTRRLAQSLQQRDPNALVVVQETFNYNALKSTFDNLYNQFGSALTATLIINAHGYNVNGKYQALGQGNTKIPDNMFHHITGKVKTTLALLTCHAGLFSSKEGNYDVFGASTAENEVNERQVEAWVNEVINNPYTLKDLADFNQSWKKAHTHLPAEDHQPFINYNKNLGTSILHV